MNALIARGTRSVEFGTWKEPNPKPDEVLVEVAACGICGTDVHVYNGLPVSWPLPGVRGHELVGTVKALGADTTGFAAGERVAIQPLISCGVCSACRSGKSNLCSRIQLIGGVRPGGFAERVTVPADRAFKIPSRLAWTAAALIEPLAVAIHLFDHVDLEHIKRVGVFGAGPQGLLAMQVARLRGVTQIGIADVIPYRLEIANQLGASRVIHPLESDPVEIIRAMDNGEGVDLAIEASGNQQARQQALRSVRAGGTVIFLALNSSPMLLDTMAVIDKEIRIQGTSAYTDENFAEAVTLLADGDIQVSPFTTEFALAEGSQVFEQLSRAPGSLIKVLLRP